MLFPFFEKLLSFQELPSATGLLAHFRECFNLCLMGGLSLLIAIFVLIRVENGCAVFVLWCMARFLADFMWTPSPDETFLPASNHLWKYTNQVVQDLLVHNIDITRKRESVEERYAASCIYKLEALLYKSIPRFNLEQETFLLQ